MCGRYTNTAGPEEIGGRFQIRLPGAAGTHRYNIAPTQQVLALVAMEGQTQARMLRWGLQPQWSLKASAGAAGERKSFAMINARLESVTQKPSFKSLISSAGGRALQVADGWYEWLKSERPGLPPQPFHFSLVDGAPFAFASLWTTARTPDGTSSESVALITCDSVSTPSAHAIHDRMPVVLADRKAQKAWLDPSINANEALCLCRALPAEQLRVHPASMKLNKVGAVPEGPELLQA